MVWFELLELEKCIEKYVEWEEEEYLYYVVEIEEDELENWVNCLFVFVKLRIGEINNILVFNVVDNLLLDYF